MPFPMIVQAIETRYLSPTNTRGARVKATAAAGTVMLHWDHALNSDDNHKAAADALCAKFNWKGVYVQGVLESGNHVFVFASRED